MASTPRWGGLRPEPYDPDAIDADNDGIVQEGTAWERPAGTRLFDQFGREIIKGRISQTLPAGLQYRDANGKPVQYTPKKPAPTAPGAQTALSQLGIPTIGAQAGTIGAPGIPPVTPKLPAIAETPSFDKPETIGPSLEDIGATTVLDLVVPKPVIPPKPAWANEPTEPGITLNGPDDIRVPTQDDLDLGVVLWREGETKTIRAELENILAGTDTPWDGITDDRAQMAAIMNAVADAPIINTPLYRGEKVWSADRFDELVAELQPGATFTTDMRGYGTDKGTAIAFATGGGHQVIYEVEPGARALRLSDAVPMSRHRDTDMLDAGADDLSAEMYQTISDEDEHLAMGTYEVISAEISELTVMGVTKQRLVVKVRQTEALDKPEGGWDAPQEAVPAGPNLEEFAAETDRLIQAALDVYKEDPSRWRPLFQSQELTTLENETSMALASGEFPLDSEIAELHRERLKAIRAARAVVNLPTTDDISDPKDEDLQRTALYEWLAERNYSWRDHYDNIRDGIDSWLLQWGDKDRRDLKYAKELENRAMMAAMMQRYVDESWEIDEPLYRGENLDDDLETVLTEIYSVGKQFELPMRGFSTEEYTAEGFARGDGQTSVVLVFDDGARALPLYEMYSNLLEYDDDDEPIEFLDDETVKWLSREGEHLVAGTVTVQKVEVRDNGTVVVTLTQDSPLSAPDGGFEQPKPAEPSLDAMAEVPPPYVESALARISERGYSRSGGIRQATIELEATKDSLADAYVANNQTRIAELEAAIPALEAELVRQKSRPRSDDLYDPGQEDEQRGFSGWIDGDTVYLRQHFDAILAGDDSVESQWAAGQPNGEPWSEDISDMAWQAFLADRRRMAALLNLYGRHSDVTTTELHRGEGLPESADVVLTEIYPAGKEFVIPMRGFSTEADVATSFAVPPWITPADGGPKTPGTGVRIMMQKGATTLDMADMAEKSDYLNLTRQQTDYLEDEKEHLVAGTVRVVSSRLAEDGKVEVVLEMVEPLTNNQDWR